MKREIKFRGKPIGKNGVWMYGIGFYKTRTSEKLIINAKGDSVEVVFSGQFSGLFDKNGNEIYEGDIVLQQGYNGRKTIMAVRFEHGAFIVGYHNGSSTQKRPMLLSDKCEVIGNIYDNKELLERLKHK